MAAGQLTYLQMVNAVLRRLGKGQTTTGAFAGLAADSWGGIVKDELNLAQAEIYKEHDWSTRYTTATLSSVSVRTFNLATAQSDFGRAISLTSTTFERVLVPVSHIDIDQYDPGLDDGGAPTAYAIDYPNLLFNRTPSAETFRFRYVRRATALSASTDVSTLPEYCDVPLVWWAVWQLASSREDFADGGQNAQDTYRTSLAAAIAQDKRRVDRIAVMQPAFGGMERAVVPFPPQYGNPY